MTTKTYAPRGVLALRQAAYGTDFPAPNSGDRQDGTIAIVDIRGPLMHHADPFFDSYDSIRSRVNQALEAKPSHLVLMIDSPGGLVQGCFEAAQEIREASKAAGVPLVAYVDGCATSAGYALACAASRIVVPATGIVGSVGVIDALISTADAENQEGVQVKLITSGARKADGNCHAPITDEAVAEAQRHVDYLADLFFDYVAASRGVPREAVASLEASIEIGENAKSKNLADDVMSFSNLIAHLNGERNQKVRNPMSELESVIALLKELAGSEDQEIADKAKRMLDALDVEDSSESESEEQSEPSAQASTDAPEEIKDPATAKAIAKIAATVEGERRERLLASRPDITGELRAQIEKLPLASAEALVKALPRRAASSTPVTTVGALRGEGETGAPAVVDSNTKAIHEIMGTERRRAALAARKGK